MEDEPDTPTNQPTFVIGDARVHIHASFDVAGLRDLQAALPLLVQLLDLKPSTPASIDPAIGA